MFKRIGLFMTLSITILMSGLFIQSTEASAHAQGNPAPVKINKILYIDWQQMDWEQINALLNQSLENWQNISWEFGEDHKVEKEQPQEEPQKEAEEETQEPEVEKEEPKQEAPAPTETTPVPEETEQETTETEQNSELKSFEEQVAHLTNEERSKNGLAPLEIDVELSKVARDKSQDLLANNYFDHNSPTYGSPFDMMRSYGISYRTAGENIAKGQQSPEEVVNAWMNSPGHRANILNGNFTHIGVGYVEQGNHWTQMFIGK